MKHKIKKVYSIYQGATDGYITVKFSNGVESRRRLTKNVAKFEVYCDITGKPIKVGNPYYTFSINRKGYGKYNLNCDIEVMLKDGNAVDESQPSIYSGITSLLTEVAIIRNRLDSDILEVKRELQYLESARKYQGMMMSNLHKALENYKVVCKYYPETDK